MNDLVLDAYMAYLRAGGRCSGTIKLRQRHLNAARKQLGQDWTHITAAMLINYLACQQWAPSTLRSHRASIKGFFQWMFQAGYISSNPAASLPTVMQPRALPRPAPENVIAEAIATAPPRVQLMLELMAMAGLRRCEVCRIKSSDLTTSAGVSAIRVRGKGAHVRIVPIPGHIAAKIRARAGYIFPGDDNGHLSAAYVGKLVSRHLPEGITGHMLRHRYASEGYRRGRDIRAVQELLGHAKLDTTMVYTMVTPDDIAGVAGSTWQLSA